MALEERIYQSFKNYREQTYSRINEISDYYEEKLSEANAIIDELLISSLESEVSE